MRAAPREVFFENVSGRHRPLVEWYVRRGDRVFVFDLSYRVRKLPWLRRLLDAGTVERIYIHHSRADRDAIEAAEHLYRHFEGQGVARRVAALFGADEAHPVLRKELVDSLFCYTFIRRYLADHGAAGDGVPRLVIPEVFHVWDAMLRRYPLADVPPLDGIVIPRLAGWWSRASKWARDRLWRVKHNAVNLGLVGVTLLGRLRGGRGAACRGVDHVYALDQQFQTKFDGGRGYEFLLDDAELPATRVAFLVHPNAEGPWLARARAAGHLVVSRREAEGWAGHLARPVRWVDLWAAASTALATMLRLRTPQWMAEPATYGVAIAIREGRLLEGLEFVNLVYTNQDDVARRWQNAVVRRVGGQSWYFMLSIGAAFVRGDRDDIQHRFWAYQNPDHFVAQSRQMNDYMRSHHQRVGTYHAIGNLWSEGVRRHVEATGGGLRRQWFPDWVEGSKVVAWFDTTFAEGYGSLATMQDAVEFYTDIEELLEERPDYWMVIKPSKDDSYYTDRLLPYYHPRGRDVLTVLDRIRRHPRVFFAGHDADPAQVIAGSDVTITYCLSSCTAEALGAGRRAFWYEPAARWKGALYDVDPLLLARGRDELRVVLDRVLAMSDAEYAAFLDLRVRGLVEDHLDGRALTRFRRVLTAAVRSRGPEAAGR